MNRNWDIMRNSANGADPYGATRRMEQNRMRDRERWTSRDREEGFGNARYFDGIPDYGQSELSTYRHDLRNRNYVGSYGDEGFGRPSQGWGSQGYGGQGYGGQAHGGHGHGTQGYGQSYGSHYGRGEYGGEFHGRGSSRYGGYGYEHGESEALGDGGGWGYEHQHRDQGGMLGRIESGIDRMFGRDWDRSERNDRFQGMRGDDHPNLWDRVKGAFTGKGPKNWARSDERIREDVCECLTYHPHVDASEIDVIVKDGEVTLTGVVHDRRTKRIAEDVVEDIRGVKDVHNQLRVVRQTGTTTGTSAGLSGTSTSTTQGGGMQTNQAWNHARR